MLADREQLRAQLVARFESHPPSTWSNQLLEVVVNAIDLQFGSPGEDLAATAAAIGALPRQIARDLPRGAAAHSDDSVDSGADHLLTRDEVALWLKVAPKTLAQWASQKKGPRYAHIGGHVRYRLSAVIAWENEQFHA